MEKMSEGFTLGTVSYTVKVTKGIHGEKHVNVFRDSDRTRVPLTGTTFYSNDSMDDIVSWAKKCVLDNFYRPAPPLFEQIANISKAHGYDVLAEQVKELKEVIRQLIDIIENDKSKEIIKKAKILSL